jgi:hypothetical protein
MALQRFKTFRLNYCGYYATYSGIVTGESEGLKASFFSSVLRLSKLNMKAVLLFEISVKYLPAGTS